MSKSLIGKALFHLWIPYGILVQVASMHIPALDQDVVKISLLFGGLIVFGVVLSYLPAAYTDWRNARAPASRINRWIKALLCTLAGAVLAMAFFYCVGGWLQAQFGTEVFKTGMGVWVAIALEFIVAMIIYTAVIASGITGIFNDALRDEGGS